MKEIMRDVGDEWEIRSDPEDTRVNDNLACDWGYLYLIS
jgi:hypothetical protein